ncbi:hypothetical protein HYH03_000681 [Edaphochlamys debaryana]|uniref:Cation/H+ exchanger domain-containing protein n=1 Tax=Edaphochlamys debaryana TaxID=47281 RepID=A0A836C7N4_9CHLO|nr:hypothetical protein HYH03_000681 [Edaphochlamys debaryana]|eukprot:KAG2502194.1 hypothetical protein HYH03_000681 [Edaphochlamys debaryana]
MADPAQQPAPWAQHALVAFSVAAILAPFSYYMGLGARLLKLPQITGYLISGIICGPYLLGILSTESVVDLNIIEGACLSIIGLAAGAELHLGELSRSKKQVLGITCGICAVTWLFCYGALEYTCALLPKLGELDVPHMVAVASLGATLMMARSPASAIAVLKEMEGKGPFSSLVMAVVVVKDVVVIIAYAVNVELIRMSLLPAGSAAGSPLLSMVLPVLSVLLSITVGVSGGLLLGILLRPQSLLAPLLPNMSPASVFRFKQALVLTLSTAIFKLAHHFDAEPLLACVTMGLVLVNRRHERADKEREELHSAVNGIMSLTNVAFFGLAGASLKVGSLSEMFTAAVLVFAVRLVAIWLGSWLGCYATGTVGEFRRLFWMSMVTQAGVAMGLARLAGTRFPDWGPHFQTFMMAIILLNLLVGPPLFRFALVRVGEARALGLPIKGPGAGAGALGAGLGGKENGGVGGSGGVQAEAGGPHAAPIRENTCGCGALRLPRSIGPLLRLKGCDPGAGEWQGSVLLGRTATAPEELVRLGGPPPQPSDGGGGEDGNGSAVREGDAYSPAGDGGGFGHGGLEEGGDSGAWPPVLKYTLSPAPPPSGAPGSGRPPPSTPPRTLRPTLLATYRPQPHTPGPGGDLTSPNPPGTDPTQGGPSASDSGSGPTGGSAALPLAVSFWRFDLRVALLDAGPQWLEYWVEEQPRGPGLGGAGGGGGGEVGAAPERFRAYLPAWGEGWRWAFHSCAGFALEVPGEEQAETYHGVAPLWADLLCRHSVRPFAALVGGGDQLYNDDVWQVPALEAWLNMPDPAQRLAAPFAPAMAAQVTAYYLAHYATHMAGAGAGPMRVAFACIPQVNTWDDHDIFDGWGSYPTSLSDCPVFKGQHTTPGRAPSDGLLVTPQGGLHRVVCLGPRQALLLPDQRAERSRYQVLPVESYAEAFASLLRLPPSVRHLVLVATVPIVYPHITGSHTLLQCFRWLDRTPLLRPMVAKTGVSSAIMNKFGEPELLDDLADHWVAPGHRGERRFLVEHLQMVAKARNCRVSIISGDVHLCGAGVLHSWPKNPLRPPRNDWRFMVQIISSAIVNAPPPTGLVKVLQWSGRAGLTNRRTRNHLLRTFRDHPGRSKLLNLRNWAEVEEAKGGELVFTLRVEQPYPPPATDAEGHPVHQPRRLLGCLPLPGSASPRPPRRHLRHPDLRPGHAPAVGEPAGPASAAARRKEGEGEGAEGAEGAGGGGSDDDGHGVLRRTSVHEDVLGAGVGQGAGAGEGRIRSYRVVAPLLEVRRTVPGSKEHAKYQGEDF